jgi:hypothetical protein
MEFTVDKTMYRSGKMNAFTQLHIVRRFLSPCLGPLGGVGIFKQAAIADKDIPDILSALGAAAAALKDEDVEYVLNACLDVTERKIAGGGWSPMRVNGSTMFDGLTLPVLLQIAYNVIADNLADFSDALPSLSTLMEKGKELLG